MEQIDTTQKITHILNTVGNAEKHKERTDKNQENAQNTERTHTKHKG